MYIFILAVFLGLNPNFNNKPTFTYLERYNLLSECEAARKEALKKIESEEDKKRVGCIILYVPAKEREV